MTIVRGPEPASLPPNPIARMREGSGGAAFTVGQSSSSPEPPAVTRLASTAEIGALLTLQSDQAEPLSDRTAGRRARDILAALRRTQAALLAADGDPAALEGLAALVEDAPIPADERLAGVLRALLLRAKVELARRRQYDPISEQ